MKRNKQHKYYHKILKKGNILSYQSGLSFVENELNMLIKNKIFIYEFIDMSKVFFANSNLDYLTKESLKNYNFDNIIFMPNVIG